MNRHFERLVLALLCAAIGCAGCESGSSGDENTGSSSGTSGATDGDTSGGASGSSDGSSSGGTGSSSSGGTASTDGSGTDSGSSSGDPGGPPDCYGDPAISLIPGERRTDWTHVGVQGGIPDVAAAVTLTEGEMSINDVQNAIDTIATPGAVVFPSGTFDLNGTLTLRSGVVLRGQGLDATHLRFDTGGSWGSAIEITGDSGEQVAVTGGFEICSQTLTLESADHFTAGDSAVIVQENNLDLMETDRPPDWNPDWAQDSVGQVVGITSVAGNTIEIDTPLRFDYQADHNPRIERIEPVTNVGIEDMHIFVLNDAENSVITMEDAENSWVRGCELEMTTRAHLWTGDSRFITVANNYIHHAFDYGNGGHGYGVTFGDRTSDSLVQNNAFDSLRHALMLKEGANGNVFAYNAVANGQHDLETDISVHGHYPYANLIEGNDVGSVSNCDWWGPSGPRMTMLRNRNRFEWFRPAEDRSHYANAVGNTVPDGEVFDTTGEWTSEHLFLEGNLISGTMEWDTLPAGSEIETSLVHLGGPPVFWGQRDWPCIGADVDQSGMANIPAMDWLEAIWAEGHGIPFPP